MTAQVEDVFEYKGNTFAVAGISDEGLFEPGPLDLEPAGVCTDCWRGYQAIFALCDSQLVLRTLHVNLVKEGEGYERREGPMIHGVAPTGPLSEHDPFNNHYAGIENPLNYSGGLLLADGFIEDLYMHMGFHPAWKYTHVVELLFANGILQQAFDRSERMVEIRQNVCDSRSEDEASRSPSDDDVRESVNRAFDRKYKL